ncbi:hypothetical protein JG688_00006780 [Phytophthora aleatoria]|uniref:HTH CENPB-type domain-containing protein n=1 Tax=Phytophthora aleatoria TaxID=2496075 RepID=A0A8J5J0J1_9STRA|nr:hypothetical protein JG688_00006780 [Phytophthora aleatoria]
MLKRPAPTTAAPAAAGSTPPSPSPPTAKKKRRSQPMGNLTNLQKRQLCIKFSQVKMTQQELCHWAKREFQLTHLPHQSTISKILARSKELTQMAPRDLSARRKGLVTHPELDTALCNWVLCARHNGLKISGDIIKSQARSLAAQLGIASTMSFSNGWLGGFKKRYNIRLGSAAAAMDGVNGVAMTSSISSLDQLQGVARVYDPRDVYCMHETGLYYELSPEKPAGRGRAARRENCGERLTVVFAVNADASDRMEPMFIGPGKLPEPAEELDADSRNFYYQNNKRAWMTPVMFQDYISAIDTRIRDEGRYILLLVSPAPSHVALGLELTNVRLEILPPPMDPLSISMQVSAEDNASLSAASESIAVNDTPMADADQSLTEATATKLQPETEAQASSVSEAAMEAMASSMTTVATLQPLDAGLIAAFKRRYRRYHMLYALDHFEAGRQDVFHVDQLQAMRWARHCWKQEIPEEIIRKCWAATEILVPRPNPETMAAFKSIEEDIDKEICDTVSALEILRPLPIDEFVSPRDENSGIHCAGLEETDFVFTVPDNSGHETKPTTNKASPSAADGAKQQVIMAPTELTPRLQELHARIEASASSAAAAAASGLGLTPTLTTMSAGDNTGSGSTAAGSVEDVLGLSSSAAKSVDGPATNEQLIECFKVLLPELDRLRFDDHTKKSIRTTFRKLKETVEQQALDRKLSTDPPTTSTPTAAPSTAQVASESSTPILQDTTSPQSNLRGNDADTSTSASSQSSSSKSVSENITGTLDGLSSTKTTVICLLGGVGIVIIMCLLFVVWRTRGREDPELGTPIAPDSATITSPPASSAPAWKAKGASFASQNLPLPANTRAKMNATTRSSAEYDMTNRLSQIASLPAHNTSGKPSRANRETNASSKRSFSVRGHSEFSVHHEGDSETSVMTNERYSTNDVYSTGDRFSTSSRLSSEVVRGNSGWFQRPVPKNLDMHRFSSTSSTASSVVARKHNKVSFVNHDLTQTPSNEAPVTTDSTTSRTDVPDWYRVIESPSDNDRYTTSSLDSDNISSERESFEL